MEKRDGTAKKPTRKTPFPRPLTNRFTTATRLQRRQRLRRNNKNRNDASPVRPGNRKLCACRRLAPTGIVGCPESSVEERLESILHKWMQ